MKITSIVWRYLKRCERTVVPISLLLWVSLILVCTSTMASSPSVLGTVESAVEPYDNSNIEAVRPIAAETVLSRERYQGGTFKVLARKQNIERFRCSSCHTDKPINVRYGAELTHGEIKLNHGSADALNCNDCHSSEKLDYLEDKKGNLIDFDHSYQLCGQCHFRQKSDWLGGAHGKRVTYWTGERVIFNCTSCHNPHSPRFEKRFPATYSRPAP